MADIIEIVRHLDGLPLAIELAAARIRAMGPAALAERLNKGFDLLAGAAAIDDPRHRTVQDLVEWSHDLLAPDEQRLFARLCVFAGGFGLDAVEEVCAGQDLDTSQVSLLLANLVDKSMVQLVDDHLPRYRLLETLREYGRDHLDEEERDRSPGPTRNLVPRQWPSKALDNWRDPMKPIAIKMLDRDFDNLRAAHLMVYRAR